LKPQKVRNELIGLDFIKKWLGAEQLSTNYVQTTEHITLVSAYSDTAAVTSCSRQSQYVKL